MFAAMHYLSAAKGMACQLLCPHLLLLGLIILPQIADDIYEFKGDGREREATADEYDEVQAS